MHSSSQKRRSFVQVLTDVTAAALFLAAGIAMFSKDGYFGTRLYRWWDDRITLATSRAEIEQIGRIATKLGASQASASIVEVGDYECPFCKANQAAVDSVNARGVGVVFLHYPLESHKYAKSASLAVMCAGSGDTSERLHRRFMNAPKWNAEPHWVALASEVGVSDTTEFRTCMTADSSAVRLEKNMRLVERLKITGTPTYIGLRSLVRGVATLDQLASLNN